MTPSLSLSAVLSVSQSQPGSALHGAHTEAEPAVPECPFCGSDFHPDRVDSGVALGYCHSCGEAVAVDL